MARQMTETEYYNYLSLIEQTNSKAFLEDLKEEILVKYYYDEDDGGRTDQIVKKLIKKL